MFTKSKSVQNGGGYYNCGNGNSFRAKLQRNGNGIHSEKEGYEEEVFDDHNESIGESSFTIDTKALGALVIATILGVAGYKLYHYRMEQVYLDWITYTFDCAFRVIKYIFEVPLYWFGAQLGYLWDYVTDERIQEQLMPFICGLVVGYFTWMMVYFDSQVPGINPPSPFSPKSKERFRHQKTASVYHGYVMAVASGLVVTGLMLGSKEKQTAYVLEFEDEK